MKEFVKSLGGASVIASALTEMSGETVKTNAVYQWPYEGSIPHRWQPYVVRLAMQRGVEVPDELKAVADIISPEADTPKARAS